MIKKHYVIVQGHVTAASLLYTTFDRPETRDSPMTHVPTIRTAFRLQEPSYVSQIVAFGVYGRIALLRDDPSRVFKFCAPEREEAAEAIEREKEILEVVGSHPFILTPHWVNDRGLCFDYYPLGSMREYCKALRPDIPPLSDRIRWCCETVIGVGYLHSKGIIHNDISPRNILLSSTLNVKICDFGFSVMIGENVVGGPESRYSRYRSYVQDAAMEGSVMDDLFSLGSLFYEILTGNMPYEDRDSEQVDDLYKAHVFPPLDNIRPGYYAEAIRKCWNEEYTSISELQDDLSIVRPDTSLEMSNPVAGTVFTRFTYFRNL